MYAKDRRSGLDSSNDHPFCRKYASIQTSCQGGASNGGDADGSVPFQSRVRRSGELAVAPVNVTEYFEMFCSFLEARRLHGIQKDGHRLDVFEARYSGRYGTALEPWKQRCSVFDRNGALLVSSGKVLLATPYARCYEERENTARLSPLVDLQRGASELNNEVRVCTVLSWPDKLLKIFENLVRWRRECDFERRVWTARRPVFTRLHNVRMFAVPQSDRDPLYSSIAKW